MVSSVRPRTKFSLLFRPASVGELRCQPLSWGSKCAGNLNEKEKNLLPSYSYRSKGNKRERLRGRPDLGYNLSYGKRQWQHDYTNNYELRGASSFSP